MSVIAISSAQSASAIGEKDACPIINYYNDFDVFLSHLISYENTTEFFKDIFSRNFCWRDDIYSVETQLQKQTAAVRKAYENCDMKSLPKLESKAYDLQMELMYLRFFGINNPDKLDNQSPVVARDSDAVYNYLERIFVNDRPIFPNESNGYFDKFFKSLEDKYKNRLDQKDKDGNIISKGSYNTCTEPAWQELNEKWDEFLSTAAGLSPAWEKMKKQTAEKAKQITFPKRNWTSFDSWLELRTNGVKPQETLNDIYEEFKKNNPFGTYSDFISDIKTSQNRYSAEVVKEDLFTRYAILYKEDVDESVKAIKQKIEELNATITNTFPIQKTLFKCAATIQEKQCRNKP